MNKFITAIKDLNVDAIKDLLGDPKWHSWSGPDGKNALHYLCGLRPTDAKQAETSLRILQRLLKSGMDINSIHRIEDKNCDFFPATPLWYAYTRGRNERIYKYLLKNGADPSHCWWAIAWYDDVAAAKLWLKHGATIDEKPNLGDLFLGSFYGKKMNFARWALESGGDVNTRGPGGITALMVAVKRKDEENIKWLLANGSDPDLKDEKGMSARRIAETKAPKRILDLFS
jgi:ankyrin repeat protein